MPYNVYLIASLGAPRNHHAIFVETETDGNGYLFHVTGNIQSGMTFEVRLENRPEDSVEFVEKRLLGHISTENYPLIEGICRDIPPPKKQFDGSTRIYPQEPLRRCQEWIDEAIQALTQRGILQTQGSAQNQALPPLV